MAYFSNNELLEMGFSFIGENVQVSRQSSIYNPENIILSDNCRVDDFCLLSGKIIIGQFVHITPYCLLAGGTPGITLNDFSTLAYGTYIFTQSDDYSGETMTNSLIPTKYKNEKKEPVILESHSIIGARSTILPGVTIAEGTAIGAMSLVLKSTLPWGIYAGIPARRIKERSKSMLKNHQKFISENKF
ncbi:acyltransferase [Marinicella gelatinilytica]|uniref:acyltransferase n=1 Tax=Marinicella gelatinilytica TaxID=2996017 RepID=UPI002260A397|nr:acyltransferase [Marinicella gelatinilytica]MCX7544501.1 acyltransferase [Marinicella gelatinilytica]